MGLKLRTRVFEVSEEKRVNLAELVAAMAGTYKIEIIKRDFDRRGAQLIIDPPDWNRWGG